MSGTETMPTLDNQSLLMPDGTRKFQADCEYSFQADAVEALTSDSTVFLSGRAGTGKSTLIKDWYGHYGANVIRLAPTGVAALNVGGQTVHRFMHWNPKAGVSNMYSIGRNQHTWNGDYYKAINAIVVDEIGMVRSDLLTMLDAFLRGARKDTRPFGGVRMILTGDLLQLPPVVVGKDANRFGADKPYLSEWFFDSPAFIKQWYEPGVRCVELTHVYRQNESDFLELLKGVRVGLPRKPLLDMLNEHCAHREFDEDAMTLTPVNRIADQMNREGLANLPGSVRTLDAVVSGQWRMKDPPAAEHLDLKVGAKVMTTVNDPNERYVNGSTGSIVDFRGGAPIVRFNDDDSDVAIERHRWTQFDKQLVWRKGEAVLKDVEVGSYSQYPLRLAYACSIHKAQGLTLDRMNLALNGTHMFTSGQAYVALSRCKTMDGIHMDRALTADECTANDKAINFLTTVNCLQEFSALSAATAA